MATARQRRRRGLARAGAALLAGMGMMAMASADGMDPAAPTTPPSPPSPTAAARAATALPAVRCTLHVPPQGVAGQPVPLRLTLHNPGPQALRVLTWQTPFEGEWFAPFVAVQRDGTELPYQGPMLKRGAPGADDYLGLPAGADKSATLDLARAFDLSRPGHYTVQPRLRLMDLRVAGGPPAAGGELHPQALDCPVLHFELRAP